MTYRGYLRLVIPLTLSTVTVPLLGAVDTALVGHLPDIHAISGVAISTVIFNTLYWLFGFLRVSTTSFTAQAMDCPIKLKAAIIRPLMIALLLGIVFVLCQSFIFKYFMRFSRPEEETIGYAKRYFDILIYGAPFTLLNYVFIGFLMGRAYVKSVLFLQVFVNVLNIVLAIVLVWLFQFNVEGVAISTLIAQISMAIISVILIKKEFSFSTSFEELRSFLSMNSLKAIFGVNSDLMIRTICLLIVTNLFFAKGSELGIGILAANSILFQVQYLMAYVYDGFANAASILSGKAKGSCDIALYHKVVKYAFWSSLGISILISLVWLGFDQLILGLFTNQEDVLEIALEYRYWLFVFPFIASLGLVVYGVFCGIGYTSSIRNSMIFSVIIWLVTSYFLIPNFGNNGLWISFLAFCFGRSLLVCWLPKSCMKVNENRE